MVVAMTCPICRRAVHELTGETARFLPFCSQRCRDVDLLRWSSGKYAIVEDLSGERLAQELLSTEGEDEIPEEY